VLFRGAHELHGRDGLQEGNEKRVVHEFVDDPPGLVELGRMRRRLSIWEAKKSVSDAGRNVDLARSARDNVDLH